MSLRRRSAVRAMLLSAFAALSFSLLLTLERNRPAHAADDSRRFLEALQQREYFDTSLYFLEQLKNDPNAPADLLVSIDYEIGVAYSIAANNDYSSTDRRANFGKAQAAFQAFLDQNPDHEQAGDANVRIGRLLISQAASLQRDADKPENSDAERRALIESSRAPLTEAKPYYSTGLEFFRAKAVALANIGDRNSDEFVGWSARLLESKVALIELDEKIGLTHPEDSDEYRTILTKAADDYHTLFSDYRAFTGGYFAKLYEARTRLALGDPLAAKALITEFTTLPTNNETIVLKTESLILLVEIDLHPDVEDYADAINRIENWREVVPSGQEESLTGLRIHMLGGKTRLAAARKLGPQHTAYRDQLSAARGHFQFVARFPSMYRLEARTLLLEPEFGNTDLADAAPQTFEEAVDAGDAAIGVMTPMNDKSQRESDPELAADYARQASEAQDDAINAFRTALSFASQEQEGEDVNRIRYILAQLYFMRGDLFHAAVLGETLARRYPEGVDAKTSASIAAKAYRLMIIDCKATSANPAYAISLLEKIGDYAMSRWKGTSQADEICLLLIDTAIEQNDLDHATTLLERIAEDSPRRGSAEMLLGQILWNVYIESSRLEEEDRPSPEELTRMLDLAHESLTSGLNRAQQADYPTVRSALALAQIEIDQNRPEEAVSWLTNARLGPLPWIEGPYRDEAPESFKISTYMTLLRAYVGNQQLDEAEAAMDKLEALISSDDEDSARRLIQVYIILGRQLQELLARLSDSGKTQEMQDVSASFETFLERISDRGGADNFASQNWLAETYFSLGAGLDDGVGAPPTDSIRYFKKAGEEYLSMLAKIAANPSWAPEGADDNVLVRLATCLRTQGEPEQAIKCLLTILRSRPNRIDVQIEAAKTYQSWGQLEAGRNTPASRQLASEKYQSAMFGDEPDENDVNLIWGWGGIAARVARYEEHRDIYFEALYNKTVCRVEWAGTLPTDEKTAQYQRAEDDILRNHQLYPSLGGADWFRRFDRLLINIRQLQRDPNPSGLQN